MKRHLTRRQFIRKSGLAAGALAAVSAGGRFASAGPSGDDRPRAGMTPGQRPGAEKGGRVIVIGAGLAGLTAALELRNAGFEVVVLEAQSRPGGRIRTLREPFTGGLYAEAGATRIPSNHDLTLEYCRRYGMPLVPFRASGPSTVYYLSGRRIVAKRGRAVEWPVGLREDERGLSIGGLREKYIMPVLPAAADVAASYEWPPAALLKFDSMTWEEFLESRGASPGAIRLLTLGHAGGMVRRASALSWIRSTLNSHGRGELSQIEGGNDRLPKAMSQELGAAIRFGTPVTGISSSEDGVRVSILDGGNQAEVAGDRVVCAVPFSVLRNVNLGFPCSEPKRKAINTLRHTPCIKVALQTRSRFWSDEHTDGFALTDLAISELWNATGLQAGAGGILQAYMTGEFAEAMAGKPGEILVNDVLGQANLVYPALRTSFERGASFDWLKDEWARGAWAYLAPGETSSLLPHLHTPEGPIHFAGDHTSPWPGWMQGAIHSGRRAALEITG